MDRIFMALRVGAGWNHLNGIGQETVADQKLVLDSKQDSYDNAIFQPVAALSSTDRQAVAEKDPAKKKARRRLTRTPARSEDQEIRNSRSGLIRVHP
jgi:hypothetical protein